ncbi:GNAT family N-acetyltransferase [Geosporobacter subterraneus]|uniref:GNAT family N-acetyltransferase n=1 Tax=Geosporobacter subterraneus TaxID=390806 RepID=UPI000DA5F493|nr:GNAT family N-acetyltransferase [Geosporobacter subterraneus]
MRASFYTLKRSSEVFYGYFIEERLVGIISYKVENDVLDMHRVAVHPLYFRRGIAEKLIHYIEEDNNRLTKAIVATGRGNKPAENLYLKNGYHKTKDLEIAKGVYITKFEKNLQHKACDEKRI